MYVCMYACMHACMHASKWKLKLHAFVKPSRFSYLFSLVPDHVASYAKKKAAFPSVVASQDRIAECQT